jgi:hypothetical protein
VATTCCSTTKEREKKKRSVVFWRSVVSRCHRVVDSKFRSRFSRFIGICRFTCRPADDGSCHVQSSRVEIRESLMMWELGSTCRLSIFIICPSFATDARWRAFFTHAPLANLKLGPLPLPSCRMGIRYDSVLYVPGIQ